MSIHAISGKPGGGKSMYSVNLILDELLYGSRVIITNVALNLARLNEYLQQEYPEKTIDIFSRVRLMDDDMTGKFWTYRPKGRDEWVRIPVLTKQEWSEGKKPLYAGIEDNGVMYVIDECHNFFNARAWAETGRDVLFYLSQHRKLGDTVIWITQAVMNVDKQFRSVTQDYTYLRNLTKEKMGLFRLPAMFVRKTYGAPATDTSQPMETGSFRLNVSGLASLYNTAAGVGIHDRVSADVGERRKGIHWLVPVIAIPCLVFAVVKFLPHGVASWLNPMRHGAAAALQHTNALSARLPSRSDVSVLTENQPGDLAFAESQARAERSMRTNRVEMVGYASQAKFNNAGFPTGTKVTVCLSDGSQWQSGDGHLQYVCDQYCVVDGVTNRANFKSPTPVEWGNDLAAPALPVVQQQDSLGASVYIIPSHQSEFRRPSVRGLSGAGYSQSFSQSY